MLTIRDVQQSKSSAIWTVCPQDSAYTAMEIMAERNIGVLVVIEEDKVVGIVSERDLARNIILKELPSREVPIENIMTKEIYCITLDRSVEECMSVMTSAHIRHMPILERNRLVGVVTFGDIVNAMLVEQKVKIQDLECYISSDDSVSIEE